LAAVTNQRALDTPPPGLRSRGLAVKELASTADPDAYVAELDPRRYASMNLVWGSADRVNIGYLRRETGEKTIEVLPRGVHVLCNDRLGACDFPRGDRLHAAITRALARSRAWSDLAPVLRTALADQTRVSIDDTPPSHLPPEIARELTANCIHTENYGTRSSTVLAIEAGRVAAYLHADGPPCTTPYLDRMELLRAA
jgi:uncharacterized protein with NRDE domain